MQHTNVEIKAVVSNPDIVRSILRKQHARFLGVDYQHDIYFNVVNGRLKLRVGNIENALIFYDRPNQLGPKHSTVIMQPVSSENNLQDILSQSLGILTEVRKEREIYFLDNVKIHLDVVEDLGSFVEIEAINQGALHDEKSLETQCLFFIEAFSIKPQDFLSGSYSDLMIETKKKQGYKPLR